MLYFAYGSNMSMEQMRQRCPDARLIARATLRHWTLVERMHADIARKRNARVHGVLWQLSFADIMALDHYEGAPFYYVREIISVDTPRCSFRHAKALVYRMTEEAAQKREAIPFSDYYRQTCALAAKRVRIPVHPLYASALA